jgi:RHS repeat-associated protein
MPKRNTAGANTIEKFTGKERDTEGNLNLEYFGARYYDAAISRWLSRDPLASKYPSLSPYNYVANNPVNAFDPDGRDIWFVHGTSSNPGTWGTYTDAISAWENVLNDRVFGRNNTNTLASAGNFRWSGKNSVSARSTAASRLASQIAEAKERNPEMLVQLVGHSHGGNVSIEAANILKRKYGITVDRLVLLGTPSRNDYRLNEDAVGTLLNIYDPFDAVQILGGFDDVTRELDPTNETLSSFGKTIQGSPAGRKQPNGININIISHSKENGFSLKVSHTTIHNTQELIDYINRILNEDN